MAEEAGKYSRTIVSPGSIQVSLFPLSLSLFSKVAVVDGKFARAASMCYQVYLISHSMSLSVVSHSGGG